MPVEIRELIIRAVVTDQLEGNKNRSVQNTEEERVKLIQQCVREVMRQLEKNKER